MKKIVILASLFVIIVLGAAIYHFWYQMRIDKAVFRDGLASFVGMNNKTGFIDPQGNWVIPPIFDETYDFYDGKASVKHNGKWGIVTKDGNFLLQPTFNEPPSYYSEGVCLVRDNTGQFGFIDGKGNWIIAPDYDDATSFWEGLAGVKKLGKWGFIDKNNSLRIPYSFDEVELFQNGTVKVLQNNTWKTIDDKGVEAKKAR